jgi:predicted  nucleic acid-binding Zn-ribbon protein
VPLLSPLLEIQAFDLAGDRLALQRSALPERAALALCRTQLDDLAGAHALLLEKRSALSDSEHTLAADVAAVATRAKDAETTLYSGTVRASKELSALQEEVRLFRVRQSELETQEMQLLEEIEQTDAAIAENRATCDRISEEMKALAVSLAAAEQAIDAEREKIDGARGGMVAGIPTEIFAIYDKLRARERLNGRAAVAIADGGCGGCHMKLPVLEYNRMKQKPDDALLLCVHCGRILVR